MLKSASSLKDFSSKIKNAQIGETLTPETVKDMAEEIMEIAEVAAEVAEEIAEGVPAEETERVEEEEEVEQIEVAADETDEEKRKRLEKTARDEDDDEDKNKIKNLEAKLASMERKAKLAEYAPKYASMFPKEMHEAKMNEIINSKQPLSIVEARIQEASDIITNKTMVKVASMTDSVYDFDTSDGGEINISGMI